MKNTLFALWNGTVQPFRQREDRTEEIAHLVGLMDRHIEHLQQFLDEKGKETLEKYQDCIDELESISNEEAFAKGFSLAVRLMAEAMLG